MSGARAARGALGAALAAAGLLAIYEAIEQPGSHAFAGTLDRAAARAAGTPRVALTFDDGPDALVTPGVLDALRARHAVATFFVVGDAVRRHPDLVRREIAEGDEVENHTRSHAHLDWLAPAAAAAEIAGGAADVAAVTGVPPRFLRPPFGRRNAAVIAAAHAQGLRVVTWTLEPRRSADVVPVAARATDGTIVLLHDGDRGRDDRGGYSAEAALVPALLDALRARGVRLVRLDELLP